MSSDDTTPLLLLHPFDPTSQHPLTHTRYYILALFSLVAVAQGLVWGTFSTIPRQSEEHFGVTPATINLLLNYGPIMFLPSILPATFILARGGFGLRLAVVIGCALAFLGSAVRCVPCLVSMGRAREAVVFLHAGQILNGVSGAFLMGVPTQLSAVWFPPHQRPLSTAVGSFACNLGPVVGFVLSLFATTSADVPWLLYGQALFCAAVLLMCLAHFPPQPRHSPSASASLHAHSHFTPAAFWVGFQRLFRNKDFVLVAVGAGVLSGFSNVWSASIPNSLAASKTLTDEQLKWLGFAATLATVLGNAALGLVSGLFERRYKLLTILLGLLSLLCLSAFTTYLEFARKPIFPALVAMISAANVFAGMDVPLSYELSAEVSFPVPEALSTAVNVTVNNAIAIIFLAFLADMSGFAANLLMGSGIAFLLVTILFVKERYPRLDVDDQIL